MSESNNYLEQITIVNRENKFMTYLHLLNQVCGHLTGKYQLCPTDEQIEKCMSKTQCNSLNILNELYDKTSFQLNNDVYEVLYSGNKEKIKAIECHVKTYITSQRKANNVVKTMITLVEDIINSKKKVGNKEQILTINSKVTKLHNMSHVEDRHVYELWSDGEIRSTKGNGLYGQRSFFTTKKSMVLPEGFVFPVSYTDDLSYAIMSLDECDEIRSEMLKFV